MVRKQLKDYIVAYSTAQEGYAAWVRVEPLGEDHPTMMERRSDYYADKLDPVVVRGDGVSLFQAQL